MVCSVLSNWKSKMEGPCHRVRGTKNFTPCSKAMSTIHSLNSLDTINQTFKSMNRFSLVQKHYVECKGLCLDGFNI